MNRYLNRSLLFLLLALMLCASALLTTGCGSSPDTQDDTTTNPDTSVHEDTTGTDETTDAPEPPDSVSMEDSLRALYDVTPKVTELPEYDAVLADPRMHAIFYEGIEYEGHPTKIFALLAYPDSAADTAKVPAVVINPWQGGSPDPATVAVWLDHGYAVLMMENQDAIAPSTDDFSIWIGYSLDEYHHPFDDFDGDAEPYEHQWLYYAAADAILAHNILRADPKIDSDKIGISGMSMGSVVTVFTVTFDDRFAFAVPGAGSAYLQENSGNACRRYQLSPDFASYWDASSRLDQIRCPVLYISGTKDLYFTCNSVAHTARSTPNGTLCLQYFLPHDAAVVLTAPEIYRFCDSICKEPGTPLCTFQDPNYDAQKNRFSFSFTVPDDLDLASVEICYTPTAIGTPDEYRSRPSLWKHTALELTEDHTYEIEVPDGTALFYIQVTCRTHPAEGEKPVEILSSSDLYTLKDKRD